MKSENYFPFVQQKFARAFESQDPEFFDVIFDIGGQKLYAHKFYLSIISDTFKAMLSNRWNSKNEPIPIIGYSFEDFKEFLKFIYSGECSINDENVFTILDLAEFYHINHLKELCDEYLSKMKLTAENIFKLMETSNKYSMNKMKKPTQAFVISNFSTLVKCEYFLHVDQSVIEEIINICTNRIKPEELFQAVYEWSENQATKKQQESIDENFDKNDAIKSVISPFLPKIRFKKMHQAFLNTYVVKRGFLFTYDKLSDILDNANPDLKVTITNSDGDTLWGYLTTKSFSRTINVIKSLKNCKSDNSDEEDMIYWRTIPKVPSKPSRLKIDFGIDWYLIYFPDGDIGVKNTCDINPDDYLLAEMDGDEDSFLMTSKSKIEIE